MNDLRFNIQKQEFSNDILYAIVDTKLDDVIFKVRLEKGEGDTLGFVRLINYLNTSYDFMNMSQKALDVKTPKDIDMKAFLVLKDYLAQTLDKDIERATKELYKETHFNWGVDVEENEKRCIVSNDNGKAPCFELLISAKSATDEIERITDYLNQQEMLLKPFLNLCIDYNIRLNDIPEICENAIIDKTHHLKVLDELYIKDRLLEALGLPLDFKESDIDDLVKKTKDNDEYFDGMHYADKFAIERIQKYAKKHNFDMDKIQKMIDNVYGDI